MKTKTLHPVFSALVVLALVTLACGASAPEPTATNTPIPPTETATLVPTDTPKPTRTPRPTKTPDLAATQRSEALNAEAQSYFDRGYLTTADGEFLEFGDFNEDWAQLGWYSWWTLDEEAGDFYLSAHFKWSTAMNNNEISGCGFVFGLQDNNDNYAVFLDKSRILFLNTDQSMGGGFEVGKTKGTGRVKFSNPAEADFALIVKGLYAYVLVDDEVIGEYTLSKSKPQNGGLGLTMFSGTNKDYGTHCEMTNLHLWRPK
jgi:hypothetical protein